MDRGSLIYGHNLDNVTGCLFHLCQSIYRHVCNVDGFQERYRDDEEFALQMRMIPALAFVPTHQVDDYFEALKLLLPREARPVINYFEDNYIGRWQGRGRGRDTPTFAIELWNVHDRVLNGKSRTNNAVEAWHRGVQQAFQVQHPTIWKFIRKLGKEQNKRDTIIEGLVAGNPPPPRKRQYQDVDARILRIVRDFGNRNENDFLRGIAYNLKF